MSDCPYCRLVAGEAIRETRGVVAVPAPDPIAPGHTILIPRRHFADFSERGKEETRDLMILLHMVCSQLQFEESPEKFNAGFSDVDAKGKALPHFHVHVIPRRADDGVDPSALIKFRFGSKNRRD